MKFLKYLLLFIVIVVAGVVIYTSFQPSEYDVSRSKVVKVPVGIAFSTVNDLKSWEKWGPWHDEDSTIVVTYGETTAGVGASNTWTSKDGPGSMKTVKNLPNELIEIEMTMGEGEPSDIIWHFAETDEGTKVTWQMKDDNPQYIFKVIASLMGGWDDFLGSMQEKGIDNLEKVLLEEEKLANSFTITPVSIKDLPAQTFIGYYHETTTNMEGLTKLFETDLPKAGMYAMQNGLQYGDFTPAAVYQVWDMEKNVAEFYIGLLLKKDLKPAEGMSEIKLPKGEVAMATKLGNYGNGDKEVHESLMKYVTENNKEVIYPIWETYVNDPMTVKPQEIQTDYYYALK